MFCLQIVVKIGKIHPFLHKKMPISSQEYDGCYFETKQHLMDKNVQYDLMMRPT